MKLTAQAVERAGRKLLATPSAVFLAVLTVGMAGASAARHAGLYQTDAVAARQANVVLACPRTCSASHPSAAAAKTKASSQRKTTTADANPAAGAPAAILASDTVPAEKHGTAKTGSSSGLSLPLPDFSAPELSRFISPL